MRGIRPSGSMRGGGCLPSTLQRQMNLSLADYGVLCGYNRIATTWSGSSLERPDVEKLEEEHGRDSIAQRGHFFGFAESQSKQRGGD